MLKTTGRHYSKHLLLCLSILLLNACSVKSSYRFLDNILNWQLGRYVSLNSEQDKIASHAIDNFHSWHKETQLLPYAHYLENLKRKILLGNVTGHFLHEESNKLQDMLDISVAKLMPSVTDIAATLSDDQVEEILDRLKRQRLEYKKDYLDCSKEKLKKRRIRDITKYIDGFFGSFTKEQKAILSAWEENLEPYEVLISKQQLNWQAEFLDAMQNQSNKKVLQNKLQALMVYRTDNWDKELQRRLDINQDNTFDMIALLFNSQTEKQKLKLTKKFDRYISDLRSLAPKQ